MYRKTDPMFLYSLYLFSLKNYHFGQILKKKLSFFTFEKNNQFWPKIERSSFLCPIDDKNIFFFRDKTLVNPDANSKYPIYCEIFFSVLLASKFRIFHISWKLINGYDLQSKKVAHTPPVFLLEEMVTLIRYI